MVVGVARGRLAATFVREASTVTFLAEVVERRLLVRLLSLRLRAALGKVSELWLRLLAGRGADSNDVAAQWVVLLVLEEPPSLLAASRGDLDS